MFDKDALEYLAALLLNNSEIPTDIPAVVMPSNAKLESLEPLLAQPARRRARIDTNDPAAFADYVMRHSQQAETGGCTVFVDADTAVGVLDYGTAAAPGWCDHRITLKLRPSPCFQALSKLTGEDLTPRQLTDWLEDWDTAIVAMSRDHAKQTLDAAIDTIRGVNVRSLGSITVSDGDFSSERSTLDQIEIAATQSRELPAYFNVTAPIYDITPSITLKVRLQAFIKDQQPRFKLRVMALEATQRQIMETIILTCVGKLSPCHVVNGRLT